MRPGKWSLICAAAVLLSSACDEDDTRQEEAAHAESVDSGAELSLGLDGGGGAYDAAASEASTSDAALRSSEPRGLYWSFKKGQQLVVGFDGYSYFLPTVDYVFLHFGDHGRVHVGAPRPSLDEMRCVEEPASDSGPVQCVPFSIAYGHITVGKNAPEALTQHQMGGWGIGALDYWPVKPLEPGTTFSGTYRRVNCYLSTCVRASFSFSADGAYSYFGSSQTAASGWYDSADFFAAGGGGGNQGRYTVGAHSITFEASHGSKATAFLYRTLTEETLVIGGSHYTKDTD